MTDLSITLRQARPSLAATAARPMHKAPPEPLPRSLAMRATSLAGALLATALLLGSQIGLAVDYTADAQARQMAAAQARVVAQQTGAPGAVARPQKGDLAVPAAAIKKAT